MDYNCRDIPMRLDIKYQPLDFDIYLSQVIEIPRTSADEKPYDFNLELSALKHVDEIIERIQTNEQEKNSRLNQNHPTIEETEIIPKSSNSCDQKTTDSHCSTELTTSIVDTLPILPSCPKETPLTPIKSTISSGNIDETSKADQDKPAAPQINPREFEEIHYNPFDHLELQTIDELRELNLVFQASYANRNQN